MQRSPLVAVVVPFAYVSTVRSHSARGAVGRDGRGNAPDERPSDGLLSGQTVGIPPDAASRFGRGHRLSCPGASSSDPVEDQAGAVGHGHADDRWVNLPPRDDGALPTRDFDQASLLQGGEGAMNCAGRHVVTPGYLRQGGQHIAGLNRAAGDRAA